MNERLTTRSFAELLANETGLERKRAEEFIEAMNDYFKQGLERNKVVKIFGLGMFKIVLVRERESVHIQTGERFVIPAHHKLTFVPDKNFKEQINRPFALFEPIEAIESDQLNTDYSYSEKGQSESVDLYPGSQGSYMEDEWTDASMPEADSPYEPQEQDMNIELEPEENDLSPLYSAEELFREDYFDLESIKPNFLFDVQDTHEPIKQEMNEENDVEPFFDDFDTPEPLPESSDYESDNEPLQEPFEYEEIAAPEPLPFPIINTDTTFTHEPKAETSTKRSRDEEYDESFFPADRKKRKAFLWLYSIAILLVIFLGSAFGVYLFLQKNSDVSLLRNQFQNTSAHDDSYPLPVGNSPDVDDNTSESATSPDLTVSTQNKGIASTGNESDLVSPNVNTSTDSTKKREASPVIDLLAPSPESIRSTPIRRANEPNREIEERNRLLANKQTANLGAARTTTTTTTTTDNRSTTTTSISGKLPSSIRMPVGSTLMQIALEYYGDRLFWVYIYEYNKNNIKDFDKVPVGLELQLPAPNVYGIDAKNAASIQRARQKNAQLRGQNN